MKLASKLANTRSRAPLKISFWDDVGTFVASATFSRNSSTEISGSATSTKYFSFPEFMFKYQIEKAAR